VSRLATVESGTPFSPELNGLSERKNEDILQKMKCFLLEGKILTKYYAIKVVEHVINRSPTKTDSKFLSPFEIVYGKIPDFVNL